MTTPSCLPPEFVVVRNRSNKKQGLLYIFNHGPSSVSVEPDFELMRFSMRKWRGGIPLIGHDRWCERRKLRECYLDLGDSRI